MAKSRGCVLSRIGSTGSTSSVSEAFSSDDDSIGPLPVLKRNKSLAVRRTGQDEENEIGKNDTRTISHHKNLSHRWIPDGERDHNCSIRLSSRPRRVQSLQVSTKINNHHKNLPDRRASMQPGAATRPSLMTRPDPPEQTQPVASLVPRRQTRVAVNGNALSEKSNRYHEHVYGDAPIAPIQPRRTSSMPFFGRTPDHNKIVGKTSRDSESIVKTDDFLLRRRSKSIVKSYAKSEGLDNDVWVERMLIREGESPLVFFKAVFSKECKSQPPTGAIHVIYMDDLVKVQHLSGRRLTDTTAPVRPPVKKRSFWVKAAVQGRDKPESHPAPLRRLKSALGMRGSKHTGS